MQRARPSRIQARIFRLTSWLIPFAVSACGINFAPEPVDFPLTQTAAEERTAFVTIPNSRAWISTPETSLVLERRMSFGSEQRIALTNSSTVRGDNMLILRRRAGGSGRLDLDDVLKRVGGLPAPFGDLTEGELVAGQDRLGTYFWAERRFGSDTICVFALRRVTTAMRQLPDHISAMDVVLRNCLADEAEAALRPILADAITGAQVQGLPKGQTRMISALAGPTTY